MELGNLSDEVIQRAKEIERNIIKSNRDKLVKKHGYDVGKIIRGAAINRAKSAIEKEKTQPTDTTDSNKETENMEENKLREMVRAALSKPLKETSITEGKGKEKATEIIKYLRDKVFKSLTDEELDEFKQELALAFDMKLNEDFLSEDLDLGHEDDEPHMIKAELAQIGKYAMTLYKMVDQFEGKGEVDFPAWWQAKITTAKNMISSAKHYLEFELNKPEIDAMVGVASEEGVIDEKTLTTAEKNKKEDIIRAISKQKGGKNELTGKDYAVATSQAKKLAELIMKRLKESTGEAEDRFK